MTTIILAKSLFCAKIKSWGTRAIGPLIAPIPPRVPHPTPGLWGGVEWGIRNTAFIRLLLPGGGAGVGAEVETKAKGKNEG